MKKQVVAIAVSAAALAFGPAVAQEMYLGGSIGQATVDIDEISGPGLTSTKDDTDTGVKALLGFGISRNFALELGYMDLGDSVLTVRAGGATNRMTFSTTAVHVDAVGKFDVTPGFAILARLGLARTSFKVNDVDNGIFCNCTIDSSTSGTNFKYGIGAEFLLSRAVRLRGEYEVLTDVGDEDTYGESDISLLSAGVVFGF